MLFPNKRILKRTYHFIIIITLFVVDVIQLGNSYKLTCLFIQFYSTDGSTTLFLSIVFLIMFFITFAFFIYLIYLTFFTDPVLWALLSSISLSLPPPPNPPPKKCTKIKIIFFTVK